MVHPRPEVEAFEREFAAWHDVGCAVGIANGTDAIELALRAAGVGRGDEVITVAHTAVPTVCAVERAGASPVLVDIDPTTYTIDPAAVEAAITPRTRAILPVHLYGHPADLNALVDIARRQHLLLVEDCAQAHGARYDGRLVGTFGDLAAFSFYPTKNLGAYGDGGAVLTNDPQLAERLKRLRNYGQTRRYHHAERGMNSRLDEMQAALLRVKLQHLDAINDARREIAAAYDRSLRGVTVPTEQPNAPPRLSPVRRPACAARSVAEALRARRQRWCITPFLSTGSGIRRSGLWSGQPAVTEQIAQEFCRCRSTTG
ncbi:MAG: DegT/DnrJ/EryC1/StrS family aminotransferase [Anaerolineae bacterium]|nr:DegT/DnrJ/EryC1/StrS family aminotransferase [Anaerolineae bacterium]